MLKAIPHSTRLIATLALPVVVLGLMWANTWRTAQQGVEWLIPIEGYDPRDLLRGHFVQYRYDWPIDASATPQSSRSDPFDVSFASTLCIEGRAPVITKVREIQPTFEQWSQRASRHCDAIAKATLGARREIQGLNTGIFYASQVKARDYSIRLANPKLRAFIRVKIRPDGVMRPVAMEFSPRSKP